MLGRLVSGRLGVSKMFQIPAISRNALCGIDVRPMYVRNPKGEWQSGSEEMGRRQIGKANVTESKENTAPTFLPNPTHSSLYRLLPHFKLIPSKHAIVIIGRCSRIRIIRGITYAGEEISIVKRDWDGTRMIGRGTSMYGAFAFAMTRSFGFGHIEGSLRL